ncbi:monovalent cation/H(+) antiporter subunit G [Microbaculum marinisediminis]|uniref:Monovalent cation/H(+) antiporter subunit G n=1 Tax=Microbaculum marinisediminis TaxID=2931392 RepID=A0AAW5QX71_9HYPH|nr:monovalent cation/H(+) antiporter subunit G [Microbaculum sp. A6E488]MCT8971258.1 monovalent cation/H(+) antiporter subunit G [Microbaculum sp. A6E488]
MTTALLTDIVSGMFLAIGSFFLVVGALGLIRMPDVFTRMHATSVSDTVGAGFLILGMIVQAGFTLVTVKLLFILAIFFFTGPLATHALARGALAVGLRPVLFDRAGRRRIKELELIKEFGVVEPQAGPAEPPKKPSSGKKSPSKSKSAKKSPGKGKGGSSSKR